MEIIGLTKAADNRFIILDCFGESIKTFDTLIKAKNYLRNKPDCTLKEIPLIDILGECLF